MILSEASNSLFDTVGGLPVHPLAVHAATVLLPLGALALLLIAFLPKWRTKYIAVTTAVLGAGALATYVAKESGEQLAARIGISEIHEQLGTALVPAAISLFALSLVIWFLDRRKAPNWQLGSAAVIAVVAIAVVGTLTFLTGHSGAEATWKDVVSSSQSDDATGSEEVESEEENEDATPSAAPSGGSITMAEVSAHNTASDCWTVVEGNVYDLTSFISRHRGGSQVLEQLCGTDGTQAFLSQHQGQGEPAQQLRELLVGPLG